MCIRDRTEGAQVAEVEALHLLVELGVLERLGHELTDRFGGADLLLRELAFDMVEEVDHAYDLVVRHPVSYTHLRAHETVLDLVCRLLLEKKKKKSARSNILF